MNQIVNIQSALARQFRMGVMKIGGAEPKRRASFKAIVKGPVGGELSASKR